MQVRSLIVVVVWSKVVGVVVVVVLGIVVLVVLVVLGACLAGAPPQAASRSAAVRVNGPSLVIDALCMCLQIIDQPDKVQGRSNPSLRYPSDA